MVIYLYKIIPDFVRFYCDFLAIYGSFVSLFVPGEKRLRIVKIKIDKGLVF